MGKEGIKNGQKNSDVFYGILWHTKTKNKTKVIDVTLSNFGTTGGPRLVGFNLVQSPV